MGTLQVPWFLLGKHVRSMHQEGQSKELWIATEPAMSVIKEERRNDLNVAFLDAPFFRWFEIVGMCWNMLEHNE